jgi:hypothetical protein
VFLPSAIHGARPNTFKSGLEHVWHLRRCNRSEIQSQDRTTLALEDQSYGRLPMVHANAERYARIIPSIGYIRIGCIVSSLQHTLTMTTTVKSKQVSKAKSASTTSSKKTKQDLLGEQSTGG